MQMIVTLFYLPSDNRMSLLLFLVLVEAGNRVSPVGGCALCPASKVFPSVLTDEYAKESKDWSGNVPSGNLHTS